MPTSFGMSSVRWRSGGTLIGNTFNPVEKILAKSRVFNHLRQLPVRIGKQPCVNLMSAGAAESLKFLLLQNTQQFRLKFERDVADFIEKERALVRQFRASDFLSDRSGIPPAPD